VHLLVIVQNKKKACSLYWKDVSFCILNGKRTIRDFKETVYIQSKHHNTFSYRGADKSLARPGRKQATATKL